MQCIYCIAVLTYKDSWLEEGHVESKTKSNQQQDAQKDQLQEDLENVNKHDDVDSHQWQLAHEDHQVYPSQKDSKNTKLSLPVSRALTFVVENRHEHDGKYEE